jgi:chromosomal replication initiation ATPase DnaA
MKDIEKIHVLEIAGMVCRDYGIKLEDLQSNRRFNRKIVLPRQVIWSLIRDVYGPRI